MSTAQEIMKSDFTEHASRHRRYWQSSSLPVTERHSRRPKSRRYPRDRVLRQIIAREMNKILSKLPIPEACEVANNSTGSKLKE